MPETRKGAREIGTLLNAIGDQERIGVLLAIADAEDGLTVTEMCRELAKSQPALSHHLSILRTAGLIDGEREGKFIRYSIIATPFIELGNWFIDVLGRGAP